MVICCGNNDTKFEELVLLKKGVFMDQAGMYALLHMHIFFQVVTAMVVLKWSVELLGFYPTY